MSVARVGDIGTTIQLTILDEGAPLDVSGAEVALLLKAPGRASVSKAATFSTNGVDGKVEYSTVAGDLDVAGRWQVQALVVAPAGEWSSSVMSFYVEDRL